MILAMLDSLRLRAVAARVARRDRRRRQASTQTSTNPTFIDVAAIRQSWTWDEPGPPPELAPIDIRDSLKHADQASLQRAFTTAIDPVRAELTHRGRLIAAVYVSNGGE